MGRRKTGSILKRGNTWYNYYTINGKQYAKATDARNKTEAQKILIKYLPKEVDYSQRGDIKVKESNGIGQLYDNEGMLRKTGNSSR